MTRIIQRHDISTNWANSNPILAKGEIGIEDNTGKIKIGDGVTTWNSLDYFKGDSSSSGSDLDQYLAGSATDSTTTIAAKEGKALELQAPTIAVGNNLVNSINGENSQLYLKQGDITGDNNIAVEKTATGAKISIADTSKFSCKKLSGVDLNDVKENGVYYIEANDANANIPEGVNGLLLVFALNIGTTEEPYNFIKQVFLRHGSNLNNLQTWFRIFSSESWVQWQMGSGNTTSKLYGTDLDNYTNQGVYFLTSVTGMTHLPFSNLDSSDKLFLVVIGTDNNADNAFQVCYVINNNGTPDVAIRQKLSNAWSAWQPLALRGKVVDLASTQTISGVKTFSADTNFSKSIECAQYIYMPNARGIFNNGTGTRTRPIVQWTANDVTIGHGSLTNIKVSRERNTYTNIDSGNLASNLPTASSTIKGCVKVDGTTITADVNGVISAAGGGSSSVADNNGIKGDYSTHYGIIDCPNGILEYTASTKSVTLKAGVVMQLAGATTLTTNASDLTKTLISTSGTTLFYGGGELLEAGMVDYQEEEPTDDGVTNYQAWFKPSLGKWQFRSIDSGNVWRELEATPIANIKMNDGGTSITRVDYIGYRIINDDIFVDQSQIETINESIDTLTTNVNELGTNVGNCVTLNGEQAISATKTFNGTYLNMGYNTYLSYDKTPILAISAPEASTNRRTVTLGNLNTDLSLMTKQDTDISVRIQPVGGGQAVYETLLHSGNIDAYALTTSNAFKQVSLTQAEYDALTTKDNNTLYLIKEEGTSS